MSTKRDGKIVNIIQNLMRTPASRLGALLDLTNKLKDRNRVGIDTYILLCELNRGSVEVKNQNLSNGSVSSKPLSQRRNSLLKRNSLKIPERSYSAV